MSRPGTTITRSETRPARSARTRTGPWFIVGTTGTADTLGAPGVRIPCKSLVEYATRFGARSAHTNDGGGGAPVMYDVAEFYFREGGNELFVSPATYHATAGTYETNIATALALFTKDLGPGQISVPGRATAATDLAVAVHAEANNRIGLLDEANTAVVATLTSRATITSITTAQERYTSLWAPWITVPGLTVGTTRTIPPSAIVAGLISKNDGQGVTPNQPSAGVFGMSDVALGVANSFIDADRATLNVNGVNLLRLMYDGVRVYGYRTLADPTSDDQWVNLANARLFMGVQAKLDAVAERFVFRQLDGQRQVIQEFGGALTGELLPYWQRGSLYGATPEEAFRVDVGPGVNPDSELALGNLRAIVALKTSPYAEEVILELVKTRITEAL